MNNQEALTIYAASFVDELALNGVKHAVVSPGSRSTPLALLLARHPDIKVHLNIDERSAGFFALGLAKSERAPVALLCTSGTAAANFYPAVVEAYHARVPLIVLTADRPHELRDVGAPQAIDQLRMYGTHVKWFAEMALPEQTEPMVRYARTMSARSASTAAQAPCGPVHLNFPLREPLVPDMAAALACFGNEAAFETETGALSLSPSQLQKVSMTAEHAAKGIIICGVIDQPGFSEAVTALAEKLKWPVLADPLSQLRSGSHQKDNVIECYDTFLRDAGIKEAFNPDAVIRFGGMPVSKPLLLFLKQHSTAKHIVVDGGGGWREPAGLAADMIHCDEILFCRGLEAALPENDKTEWLSAWQSVNEVSRSALSSIRDVKELDEGKLFLLLNELMPENVRLFSGNSMPIRDLDTFTFSGNKAVRYMANRGANGIDGVVSTALGVSAAEEPAVLVIGDLSFYHDMNGLLAGKLHRLNLTIILINNDGGGIFSFLPQAEEKEYFEMLFGTPHGLDFSHTADLYGAKYQKPGSWEEFTAAFTESFTVPGLKIIEITTDREANVLRHRKLWDSVSREIQMVLNREKS